jgi:hypothetical protein
MRKARSRGIQCCVFHGGGIGTVEGGSVQWKRGKNIWQNNVERKRVKGSRSRGCLK